MERTSMQKIMEITGGRLLAGDPSVTVTGMDIDSRTVKPGDLFVAIVGERVDAHRFVPQVIESGVRGVLITEEDACPEGTDACIVLVPDAVKAMQQIGKWYLDAIDVRRVGVTGSVGKTTTRDMIYHILKEKYRTGSASKNHNSLIGMPLAITQFDSSMEVVVLEEGMGGAGDIHLLSDLARPEVAVITNVGISHLEILGSRENIRKAKLEIVDFFRESDTLVINADNDMLDADRIREEKGRYTVKSAEAERSFYGLAEDPDRYGEAAFVLELTARLLPEGVPQPRIFDLMTDMFSALENRRNRFLTLRLAYEVKLMDLLGVAPRTDCCVRCGKKNGLEAFSVPGGGALCGECHRKLTEEGYPDRLIYPARFDMMNVIDYFRSNPLKRFEKLALNDGAAAWMQNVIRRYMAYYLDVDQLKSEAAMNQEGMLQWKSH